MNQVMGRFFVYADSSGQIDYSQDKAVVLATIAASESQVAEFTKRMEMLRKVAADLGVDSYRADFEFHTYELFNGIGDWRGVSEKDRLRVLSKIREIIQNTKVPYAVVVIQKPGTVGGQSSYKEFDHDVKEHKEETLTKWQGGERQSWEQRVPNDMKRKGFGPLKHFTGVLFGYTNALMHRVGLVGETKVIVDEQFLKQAGGWDLLFQMLQSDLPERVLAETTICKFLKWPHSTWQLKDLTQEKSHSCYGIQLADFVAHTTWRLQQKPSDRSAAQIALVNNRGLFPLPKTLKGIEGAFYEGIYVNYYPPIGLPERMMWTLFKKGRRKKMWHR